MALKLSDAMPATSNDLLRERSVFEGQLLNVLPELRAFARFLGTSQSEADDLVQETVLRALRAFAQFDLNTNIKAWTFTILRNIRLNSFRERKFDELDEVVAAYLQTPANQDDVVDLKAVLQAFGRLPPLHREVLTLVRLGGLSYAEAAEVMGCKLGTIKSRLNRADFALRAFLGPDFRPSRGGATSLTADEVQS